MCLNEPGTQPTERINPSVGHISKDSPWELNHLVSNGLETSLPDPCVPFELHSEESVAHASAILRRIRLTRAARYIVGGGVCKEKLVSFLQGPKMRGGMVGLPIWWCPWIHDLALLIHVATSGLFQILNSHKGQARSKMRPSTFSSFSIETHIRSLLVQGKSGTDSVLPSSFLSISAADQMEELVKSLSLQFPSAIVIERRIALICAEMTKGHNFVSDGKDNFFGYINIPMFDHGG